jgi:hypothetical protein
MKKLIIALLFVFVTSFAFGASTMVTEDKGEFISGVSRIRTLTVLGTAHTDGSFSVQLTDSMFNHIRGWMITEVRISNSTTQTDPTINSDVTFTLTASGFDLLYGAGVDRLDNDAINQFVTIEAGASAWPLKVVDRFFVEVANNSVSTAIFNIMLILVPSN